MNAAETKTLVPEADGRVDAFDLVAQVTARLERVADPKTGVCRQVLGALDAAALKTWPKTPAVFVVPLAEDAAESAAPRVRAVQRAETTVAVQMLVSAPNDRSGSRARDELALLIRQTRGLLAGFCPDGAAEGLRFVRGRLIGLENGRLEWRDEYALVWWIDAPGQDRQPPEDTRAGDPNLPASMRRER